MTSTDSFYAQIKSLSDCIACAEAIVVGAGSGLSSAAGYTYTGERFNAYFSDFAAIYGFADMYSGGFYPFPTDEEFWAYWSRYIFINRYEPIPNDVYKNLRSLLEGREYFVITTNVDHCFQRAGFDKERLFYTQGDYGLWQCSLPCHEQTYDNENSVRSMRAAEKNMRVPPELFPRCPKCGRVMTMNLRADERFVQDEGWYAAAGRYKAFLNTHAQSRVLFWELGVGDNTPAIIKYPFWSMTKANKNASYVCVNASDAAFPDEIASCSMSLKADIGSVIKALISTDGK